MIRFEMDHFIDNYLITTFDNALTFVHLNCFAIKWKKMLHIKYSVLRRFEQKYLYVENTPHMNNLTTHYKSGLPIENQVLKTNEQNKKISSDNFLCHCQKTVFMSCHKNNTENLNALP